MLRAVHPGLGLTEQAGSALSDPAFGTLSPRSLVLLALLAYPASDAQGVCRRLNLSGRRAEAVMGVPRVKSVCGDLEREPMQPSRLVDMLQPLDDAAIEACMLAMGGDSVAGERMRRYLTELRHVRPSLNGSDLMGLGCRKGRGWERCWLSCEGRGWTACSPAPRTRSATCAGARLALGLEGLDDVARLRQHDAPFAGEAMLQSEKRVEVTLDVEVGYRPGRGR